MTKPLGGFHREIHPDSPSPTFPVRLSPMRKLTTTLCVTLAVILGSSGVSFALPSCPGSYNKHTWTDCFGTWTVSSGVHAGFKYVGEFWDGTPHGQGTYTFSAPSPSAGEKYVGEVRYGKKHGQGTYTFRAPSPHAGQKYVGEFRDNKYHGQGTQTFSAPHKGAGVKYVGEFRKNKRHGQGTLTFSAPHKSAGYKYVGEFWDDKRHGQGTLAFSAPSPNAGEKYVGEVRYGKRWGQGTYTWSAPSPHAGQKYVGEYKDNKYHGQGIFTYANGLIMAGFYRHGKVVKPSQYLAEEVREQLTPCFSLQMGMKGNNNYRPIKITIELTKNGALEKPPTILNSNLYKNNFNFRARAESAIMALKNPICVPFKLPLSLYDSWKTITFYFDDREFLLLK